MSGGRARERGQALAETMLAIGVLAAVWAVLPALWHLHDLALQQDFASRYGAWQARGGPRNGRMPDAAIATRFFGPGAGIWRARGGTAMSTPSRVEATAALGEVVPAEQIGREDRAATHLRGELLFADRGLLTYRVAARPELGPAPAGGGVLGTAAWDAMRLRPVRQTALWAGGGASDGTGATQRRLAAAPLAWRDAAAAGASAGQSLALRMRGVDAAWRRPDPGFEWLSAWDELVPPSRLVRASGARAP